MYVAPRSASLRPARPRARIVALIGALAAACVLALALATSARASTFEWEGAFGGGLNPGAIATDAAGRVYVPQRGAGVVYIYDSARNSNRLIGSIGAGRLQDPSAVAVDNRLSIYVADSARDAVVTFGPLITGAAYRGVSGGSGTALGQMRGVTSLATDPEPRVYASEAGNHRVQAFDPARGTLGDLFAFGTSDPAPFGPPASVTVDSATRFFVAGASADSGVRVFDSRGVLIGGAVPAGNGPGQVSSPNGIDADPADRLLIADTGNDRVAMFNSLAGGLGHLATFGSSGAGDGQFAAPTSLARAPGAMLYVADAGNGRIVRLRYDDADRDGAIDALDNCRGLANVDQIDHDGDGAGDACDDDDDGDGLPDASDPCPVTNPLFDRNRDGCADPVVSRLSPKRGASFKAGRGPAKISGRARADNVGVARVLVAVGRRAGGRCAWWSAKRERFVAGSCGRPRWQRARGASRWRLKVSRRAFKRGGYTVHARAVQRVTGAIGTTSGPALSFKVR